jgi:hypothetical protein
MKTDLGRIYSLLYDGEENAEEAQVLWNMLFDAVDYYAGAEHDRRDVSQCFFDIADQLCQAAEMQGFKRGLALTMRLAVEALCTPDKSRSEAERKHKAIKAPSKESAEEREYRK